ncbi:hypothetical protein BAU15_12975 [Enterococcus sp. JM4C]|uniref:permease prefix domain 1-containing protein n=1 Tax=Candidatus Enterococcus huntleyi TaxID=1857217 RepID=UPI00137B0801|nr:permease prefix domain 1-containing protein [Enterococcus sp. JM4C]KAF1297674.1 hypothetical protein BAU15_12975 [Enterococcus sp. JM4C]
MDTIKTYLDGLFLAIPETIESRQLKTDLLANMEDRYLELVEEGKSENEAVGTTISEFGSIDELLAELHVEDEDLEREEPFFGGEAIGVDEAQHYLARRRSAALMIALGVGLIIVGVGVLILASMLYLDVVGVLFLFLFIAIAVGLFITGGVTFSKINKELDDRYIAPETANFVSHEKEQYQRSFVLCLVLGIGLCIFSVAPPIAFGSIDPYHDNFGAACMFFMLGLGVLLIVYGGINQGGFTKFLAERIFIADEDEMGPRAKKHKNYSPTFTIIAGIYWPVITIIFFIWGFSGWMGGWATSWLIYIFSGAIFNVIKNAFGVRE